MKYFYIIYCLSISIYADSLDVIRYNPFEHAREIITTKHKYQAPRKTMPSLHLVAIFNQKAVINGRFYKKNDKINGFRIISISSHRVVLKKGKQVRVLRLMKNHLFHMKTKTERIEP